MANPCSVTGRRLGTGWQLEDRGAEDAQRVFNSIMSNGPEVSIESLRMERGKRSFHAQVLTNSISERLLLKEFGSRGPLDASLLRHLRPVPGRRYSAVASALETSGVLTAQIRFVATREAADGRQYLIGMQKIDNALTLAEMLQKIRSTERAELFHTTGRAVARIHSAGVFHFDLNEDNLLFRPRADFLEGPYFVDLDYTVRTVRNARLLHPLLARLDLHQFFTIRNAEIKSEDRKAFWTGYRSLPRFPGGEWQISLQAPWPSSEDRGYPPVAERTGDMSPPESRCDNESRPKRFYPKWKRYLGTGAIHLFRGLLLVCRIVH